jgi:hypothetical protein
MTLTSLKGDQCKEFDSLYEVVDPQRKIENLMGSNCYVPPPLMAEWRENECRATFQYVTFIGETSPDAYEGGEKLDQNAPHLESKYILFRILHPIASFELFSRQFSSKPLFSLKSLLVL